MTPMEFTVKALGQIDVHNELKDTVRMSGLWKDATAALVFVRHFG